MPQVVDLPPIGQDQRGALASLVRICKDTPSKGESFKEFRSRLRAAGQGDVQVQAVPCVGRCEQAPVAVVHQCPDRGGTRLGGAHQVAPNAAAAATPERQPSSWKPQPW